MGTAKAEYTAMIAARGGFHSINVPSEWGPLIELTKILDGFCFHSINVPSEWGPYGASNQKRYTQFCVSIQLMSPASGDTSS